MKALDPSAETQAAIKAHCTAEIAHRQEVIAEARIIYARPNKKPDLFRRVLARVRRWVGGSGKI